MKRVEIDSRRTLLDDRFRVVEVHVRYERPDGEMSDSVRRLILERGEAAAAVVFDPAARVVLLTRQFRLATYDRGPGWMLELPAGEIEHGESPEVAIRREILEEIGYGVDAVEPIAAFYLSPGGSSERLHLFAARVERGKQLKPAGGNPHESEDIELVEVSFDELAPLLESAAIADAKTLIGLRWLADRVRPAEAPHA